MIEPIYTINKDTGRFIYIFNGKYFFGDSGSIPLGDARQWISKELKVIK